MTAMSAYEKMLNDGTAFKKIEFEQPTPDNPEGGRGYTNSGDPDEPNRSLFEHHMDQNMDDKIEQAKRLKEERMGRPMEETHPGIRPRQGQPGPPIRKTETKKMKELERRISMLEQALQLVMETQTKLLKESE